MPPENSCGYSPARRRGVGDADQPEQLDRALLRVGVGYRLVDLDRLDELLADLVVRVKRGERVLEDHRDVVAADQPQLLGAHLGEVAPLEGDPPRDLGVVRPGQAEDGEVGDALARAGLADDPERLPAADLVGDAVNRLDHALVGRELNPQVLDLEHGSGC